MDGGFPTWLLPMLALLVALLVQTVAIVWWAATTTQRVATLEDKAKGHNGNGEKLASIDARLEGLEGKFETMEGDLKSFIQEWRSKRR